VTAGRAEPPGSIAPPQMSVPRPTGGEQETATPLLSGSLLSGSLLSGSLARLDRDLAQTHEGGGHPIFPGTVLSAGRGDRQPLLLLDGGFHHGAPSARSA
jgi:flavin reductase (DIM6/NTAB) family NADH-FMN oxidoreductase RutF